MFDTAMKVVWADRRAWELCRWFNASQGPKTQRKGFSSRIPKALKELGAKAITSLKSDPKKAVHQKVPWYTAVVQDGWKYVRYLQPGVPEELYHLKADPEELKNLAGKREHAQKQSALRRALFEELKRSSAPAEMKSRLSAEL